MAMAFVHPAAVVPLLIARARFVDGVALIAGALGPDLEYFVALSATKRLHTHPVWAVGGGAILALLVVGLIHAGAGRTIASALPRFLSARFAAPLTRPRHAASIAISVVIGAGLHVLWDLLSERGGPLADVIPWRTANHISAIAGTLVIVVGIALAPRGAPATFRSRSLIALIVAGVAGALVASAFRAYILDGTTRDALAAASGGALWSVLIAALARDRIADRTSPAAA